MLTNQYDRHLYSKSECELRELSVAQLRRLQWPSLFPRPKLQPPKLRSIAVTAGIGSKAYLTGDSLSPVKGIISP